MDCRYYLHLPKRQKAAIQYEREILNALINGMFGKEEELKQVPTLKEYSKEFMDTYVMIENKPSEQLGKKYNLKNHILPELGSKKLDEITTADIRHFQASKIESGLTKKSVKNIVTILNRMLTLAKEDKKISALPKIPWLKIEKPSFDFLNFEEAEQLVNAAEGQWKVMIIVALKTGLRLGELKALRWKDINFEKMQLVVNQNYVCGQIGTPKSGKAREIPLCDDVLQILKAYRHLNKLVFCQPNGKHWYHPIPNKNLEAVCKKAGIRRITWHVLRHTFASHLAMRGAPMKSVQEFLGHSTMEMTMRYAHLSPEARRDAVQLLNGNQMATPKTGNV